MRTIKGIQVLDRADIERISPSFYAEHAKSDVSDEYQFINSRDVAIQLWDAGWMLTQIQEQRANDRENFGFTKHIMRFAHRDYAFEEERISLVGVNAHNRASSFKLMSGIDVFACLNGMLTAGEEFDSFAIRHIGMSVQSQVSYALDDMASTAEKIAARIKLWKSLDMSPEAQDKFARAVHILAWGDKPHAPVDPHHILRPRRSAEESPNNFRRPKENLWTTMNVLQENVVKGGLRGTNSNGGRHRTRPILAIDRGVKFNQTLWQITDMMATKLAA